MFRTKTRTEKLTEQLQEESESLASTAAAVAEQLRERVVPAVGQATESALEWARPRVEHGIEVAAPKLESAVNGLAPKVDTARDKIVDELIPRIAEAISAWAAASSAAKDEAVSRGQGAAAVLAGDAVATPKSRKKKVFLVLGLFSATAAGAIAFMKRSAPKDDPWTTPLADPYIATPNGRHSADSPLPQSSASTSRTSGAIDSADDSGTPVSLDPSADHGSVAKDGDTTGGTGSTGQTDRNDVKKSPRP